MGLLYLPLRTGIDDLVERKRAGSELARGPRVRVISEFIESEFARHATAISVPEIQPPPTDELDEVVRAALEEG